MPKQSTLNLDVLDICTKIDQLQRKLSLELPMRKLFPFNGIQIKDRDSMVLFEFLKPFLHPFLNENNVHTLSRIISLAFKKDGLQHLFNS